MQRGRVSSVDAVEVSADRLNSGQVLPGCCAKHGLPAVRRVDFVVKSRPKLKSVGRLWVPGYTAVDRTADYLTRVKFIKVAGWPLCITCVRRRTLGLALASLLFFGGIAAIAAAVVIGLATSPGNRLLAIPFLAGFVAIVASPWPFSWGGLPRITQTEATPAATAVIVHRPHSRFRDQAIGEA